MKVWRTHFDKLASAIQDPDSLAEEATKAGLILVSVKELLTSAALPAHDKTLTVLLTIERQIKDNPQLLHTRVIPLLRRQPGLEGVAFAMQANYGESQY